jgi:YbgC/YbaW family acyl-CoA thioester hydrolase
MWGDLDSLGIVFYPRYYEWIDACGHLYFEAIGLPLGDLWRRRNLQFGLVETSCRYHKPARYHQEIRITTYIQELEVKTVRLKHTLCDAKDDSLLVEGVEQRICLDVSDLPNFKAVPIPEDIYEVLKKAKEK